MPALLLYLKFNLIDMITIISAIAFAYALFIIQCIDNAQVVDENDTNF